MIHVASAICGTTFGLFGFLYFDKNYPKSILGLILIIASFVCSYIAVQLSDTKDIPNSLMFMILTLYLIALSLFLWTSISAKEHNLTVAFSSDIPTKVLVHGPYQWIRHPFYTSYIVAQWANFVAAPNAITLVALTLQICILYNAARSEEQKFNVSNLQDTYSTYKLKTGMFIPFI